MVKYKPTNLKGTDLWGSLEHITKTRIKSGQWSHSRIPYLILKTKLTGGGSLSLLS